ncbi:MAG TPA: hypothetical protein VGE72_15500 [Azospirillum sp.]
MRLTLRLFLAIWLIIAGAAGLLTLLNHFKFATAYADLVRSRFAFLAADLEQAIEAGLSLGLPIDQLRNTQAVIQRTKERWPEIVVIRVFDPAGTTLFGIGDGAGAAVPPAWLEASRRSRDGAWSQQDEHTTTVAKPLVNAFGLTVGWVALTYSHTAVDAQVAGTGGLLVRHAVIGLAVAALLCALLLPLLLRPIWAEMRRMEAALRTAGEAPEGGPAAPVPEEIAASYGPFRTAVATALGLIRTVPSGRT